MTVCSNVQIKYIGNGQTTVYSFPFTYMSWQDVEVLLYDETIKDWVVQTNTYVQETATSVKFITAPPTPSSGESNIWIRRNTDITAMLATYYPGSSIRAQDLNDDFDQLRMAQQESDCDLSNMLGEDSPFVRSEDLVTYDNQVAGVWGPSPSGVFGVPTIDAVGARSDAYVQSNLPAQPTYQQPGKNWQNTDECWTSYWNPQAEAWVAYVNTGPRGAAGQDGAAADISVGTTVTSDPGSDALVVDSGSGNISVLNFTIPRGAQGPKGDVGSGITITGYIDVPGPPSFNGTQEGEFILDSNSHGWFWETDTDPDAWIDTGTIQGPAGPQGTPGTDGTNGTDGAAATVAVGLTATGAPGTDAQVVNVGSNIAAELVFTIPQGAKGDPGDGAVNIVTGASPITVDNTDIANPVVQFNISSLPVLPE